MTTKKIAIVILNWNGARFLEKYLPSVIQSASDEIEIVVADNGSTDQSIALLCDRFPQVTVIQLPVNLGFARGYNEVLSRLDAEYFMLLNSDVTVSQDWLVPLLNKMEADPNAGICQPKILSLERPDEFEYAGASGGFLDRFGYPFCRGRILQTIEKDFGQYNDSIPIAWASGAALMIRADLWRQLGGFDGDFWAHMEEIDLCWRASHLGFRCYVCPDSVVYHLGGGSLPYRHPTKNYLNFRNNLFLLFKNLRSRELFFVIIFRMVLDGISALVFLAKGEVGSFFSVLKAHISFYLSLPSLTRKRKMISKMTNNHRHNPRSSNFIVLDYFLLGRKRFDVSQHPSVG